MGRTLGKYELGARIACGGMAEIFHATRSGAGGFRREFCVKLVQSQYSQDAEFRLMFQNEALIAGKLSHANVVQVYDYDREGDLYYIAMEYVFGKDLRAVLNRAADRGERLPLSLAARVCLDAARGLGAAHRLGIIHRDVSPHNILLAFDGGVKITDFGIARLRAAASATRDGALKGKVNYMSPEQALGRALDVRSDVFSLGIVLWEVLTGGRLFEGESEVAVLEKVRRAVIAPPSAAARYVPPDLDGITMKALERDPEARYADADAFADALQKFLYSWTHEVEEESVAVFLAQLFPEEKRPAARERTEVLVPDDARPRTDPPDVPVPAGPGERTATQPAPRKRGPVVVAAAALASAGAAVAYLYFAGPPGHGPGTVAAPTPAATVAPAVQAPAVGKPAHPPPSAPIEAANPPKAACAPGDAAEACGEPTEKKAAAAPGPAASQKKTPRAKEQAPQKTGLLTINANPWADVYFKGKKIGTTPLTGFPLPEGEHRIVLKNPEIGAQREISVKITAGAEDKESVTMR